MSPTAQITCIELVELVTDYAEGALEPAEVERFEAHLALCEGCTIYVEQMRETIAALGHLPEESISDEAQERLLVAFADWRAANP